MPEACAPGLVEAICSIQTTGTRCTRDAKVPLLGKSNDFVTGYCRSHGKHVRVNLKTAPTCHIAIAGTRRLPDAQGIQGATGGGANGFRATEAIGIALALRIPLFRDRNVTLS